MLKLFTMYDTELEDGFIAFLSKNINHYAMILILVFHKIASFSMKILVYPFWCRILIIAFYRRALSINDI